MKGLEDMKKTMPCKGKSSDMRDPCAAAVGETVRCVWLCVCVYLCVRTCVCVCKVCERRKGVCLCARACVYMGGDQSIGRRLVARAVAAAI